LIKKLIINSLAPLNIPVSFQKYSGDKNLYITFHEYFTIGETFDDDEESITGHFVQLDVWSDSDYTNIVKNTRKIMTNNGFKRLSESDLCEEDTKIYHKVMKFYYMEGE
jgi:hypothetical protein